MTYITDAQVDRACATLKRAIEAAENSNQAGEDFVVAAAAASELLEALERIATVDMGGGFLSAQACRKIAREALLKAKGGAK